MTHLKEVLTFNDIWDDHKSHLLGFINTKIDDENISYDILQEVSIKLFNHVNQKKVISNHKNWLFQVTRNTIADHYRKHQRQTNFSIEEPNYTLESTSCVCDLSGFVIQKYLPEKYGKPLYLSDIEQMPQQEIAETLNLSLTATKSRIQRAREKLKALISDCIDIEFNKKGEISDFHIKNDCVLPQELKNEMDRINLIL